MGWRMAGLNYVNYSNIAARTLRRSLKSNLREEASKRDESQIKCYFWEDGNMLPLGQRPGSSGGSGSAPGGGKPK